MPTTRLKNTVYRVMLPFFAPKSGPRPISAVAGRPLVRRRAFVRLIRRHHVLGSATLLSSGDQSVQIFTDSSSPNHHAEEGTYFRVASITKTATAVLAMRLMDEGCLSLDEPVSSFFRDPEAKSSLEGITLRHLLSHTSGIVDPPDLESALENEKPFTGLLPSARVHPPGQAFVYSNFGFGLIGSLFESLFGLPLGEIYSRRLFVPLGMNATLEGCTLPRERIMPVTRIFPYHKGSDLVLTALGRKPLVNAEPLLHYGHTAGSMYTDVVSLQALLRVLMPGGTRFLSDQAVREMKKEQAAYGSLSPTLSYGLGLLRIHDPSVSPGMVYGHQGFAYGCADGAFWEEETGRVVITVNGGCSEARTGRLGLANRDFLRWALKKEMPSWS